MPYLTILLRVKAIVIKEHTNMLPDQIISATRYHNMHSLERYPLQINTGSASG